MRISKLALSTILATALILGPVSVARADMATPSPTTSSTADEQHNSGEIGEHKRIDDGESGTDSLQWIFVGAAIVIALGLAYNAGRRQRKKKAE